MGVRRDSILRWAKEGHLPANKVHEAMRVSGALPDRSRWGNFIDGLLLWGGLVLLVAGVIFFFAYNWKDLGNLAKFGIVELLLVAAVGSALWRNSASAAAKASLFCASVLCGALLALFGQTYQTGADTYELFLFWAAAILPWTLVCRLPALWMLLITLLNTAIALYFQTFHGIFSLLFSSEIKLWLLFAFNSVALLLWEYFGRHAAWLRERWATRLICFGCGGIITALAMLAIFDTHTKLLAGIMVYPIWLVAIYLVYRYVIFDLFMLAGGLLSAIVVITSFLSKGLLHASSGAAACLFIGIVVIGLSAASGMWLRNIAQEERR